MGDQQPEIVSQVSLELQEYYRWGLAKVLLLNTERKGAGIAQTLMN